MKTETAKAFVALRADGHRELYFSQIGGRDVVFRPLTFDEYNLVCDLERHMDGPFINDTIIRLCILYTDWDDGIEGLIDCSKGLVPDKLAELILRRSKFQDENAFIKLVHEKRMAAYELDSVMQTYVCSVFKVSPAEYEKYTLEEQVRLFAMAEVVIGNQVNVEDILSGDTETRGIGPPVPEGMMSSTDFLNNPDIATMPKF
jgi:hypothetical protein